MPYSKKTGMKVPYTKSNIKKAKSGMGGLIYKKPVKKAAKKMARKKMKY